jgi:hypothetical protein
LHFTTPRERGSHSRDVAVLGVFSATALLGQLSAMWQRETFAMIQRAPPARASRTRIGKHGFRGDGIPVYMQNGGTLERSQTAARPSRSPGARDLSAGGGSITFRGLIRAGCPPTEG